ncbi:MAG TPA: hypothetical protein VFC51_14700 [Chloroflexota bacterium]|nr:hypothetical protein [Chloroflexota bacterium]
MAPLSELQQKTLEALVEGYRAREGMKDRIRALNEWEIARRSGFTELSYAEFQEDPSRNQFLDSLMALQRLGLISVWERGVKYDTFVPTEQGNLAAEGRLGMSAKPASGAGAQTPSTPTTGDLDDQIIHRLDEIIRLLKSLDSKLGGP